MGAYYATSVLTSLGAEINAQDIEGHTPLHLAVLSANTRVVRLLLLKGAERNIKNNIEKNAIDIAKDNQSNDLIDMLKPEGILEKCGYRPLLKPYKKTSLPFYVVIILIISCLVANILFCSQYNLYLSYSLIAFGIATVSLMIYLARTDPGYAIKAKGTNLSVLFM